MSGNSEKIFLEANINGKIEKVEIPEYSLRYPTYNNVSLTAIKRSIDQPRLKVIYGHEEPGEKDERLGFPIRLIGNVEKVKRAVISGYKDEKNSELKKEFSCTSGRENTAEIQKPKKEQFRFNRVRTVPDDWPNHGRRESHLSTVPGLDKFGAKAESRVTFNHRENDGFKYTNARQGDAFIPYGYTHSKI